MSKPTRSTPALRAAQSAALALAMLAGAAAAADEPALIPAAQIAALADSCAACHGTDGRADAGMPTLAGNPEAVMRLQLLAFRNDEIPGATVMPRLARGFSEAELSALAAWFAAMEADSPVQGAQP